MHIVSLVLCGGIIPLYDRVRLLGVFIRQLGNSGSAHRYADTVFM